MRSFLENLDEAVQRTSAAKQKIKAIQVEFEEAFGDRLYSKKFEYDVVESDLKKIFMIANKHLFKEKLNVDNVIFVVMSDKRKDKGTFKAGKDASQKDLIGIVKYDKDNFFQIVNVVLHEMIHLYDSRFGPLKDVIKIAYVDNINNRQYVDRYDVHGKYFKDWCKKLNYFGFEVKETYSIDDKRLMKKINEEKRNSNSFFDAHTKEDDEQYKRVKAAYDLLDNCNKDMVYRDADHWYIQID